MMTRVRRSAVALVAILAATAGFLVTSGGVASAAGPLAYTEVYTGKGCQIVSVDLSDGTTTLLPTQSYEACVDGDLAMAPDGTLWAIATSDPGRVRIIQFNATTGAPIDQHLLTGNFILASLADGGIAFDANGVMFVQMVTDETGCFREFVCLYRVNPATGASTFVGSSLQLETTMFFLTANCAGGMLTAEFNPFFDVKPGSADETTTTDGTTAPNSDAPDAWSKVDAQNGLFDQLLSSVNPNTGVVLPKVLLPPNFDLFGVEYDRVTGVLYVIGQEAQLVKPGDVTGQQPSNDTAVFSVNTTTGALTFVADFDDSVGDIPHGLAIGGSCASEAPIVVRFTG